MNYLVPIAVATGAILLLQMNKSKGATTVDPNTDTGVTQNQKADRKITFTKP